MGANSAINELRQLSIDIPNAENSGDKGFFERLLAPVFAFRRASAVVVDRQGFLDALKGGGDRETELESIQVTPLGGSRALVTSVVAMGSSNQRQRFDNARLFVKDENGEWRLLGWANEICR